MIYCIGFTNQNQLTMKKITILAIAFGFMSISANSQDLKSKRGESFLPEKGDWAIGFNTDGLFQYLGNAFNGSSNIQGPDVNNVDFGVFGKKFITSSTAYRADVNLVANSNKSDSASSSVGFLIVGLGKEWRKGKTRLQGYYGADALLILESSKGEEINNGITTKYKSGLGIGVGAKGFLGAEYFIFPKLSIGAEYNYSFITFIQPKSKTTTNGTTVDGNSYSQFGLSGVQTANITASFHF